MSYLLLLLLVLPLSNCESVKQSGLEDAINIDPEEKMYNSEKLNNVTEKEDELIQRILEIKDVEIETLRQQLKEVKVQFAKMESRMEDQNQEITSLKSEMKAEVKKELNSVLPVVVEHAGTIRLAL